MSLKEQMEKLQKLNIGDAKEIIEVFWEIFDVYGWDLTLEELFSGNIRQKSLENGGKI